MEMVGEDLCLCVLLCVCVCGLKTPPERESVTTVFLRTYCFSNK